MPWAGAAGLSERLCAGEPKLRFGWPERCLSRPPNQRRGSLTVANRCRAATLSRTPPRAPFRFFDSGYCLWPAAQTRAQRVGRPSNRLENPCARQTCTAFTKRSVRVPKKTDDQCSRHTGQGKEARLHERRVQFAPAHFSGTGKAGGIVPKRSP